MDNNCLIKFEFKTFLSYPFTAKFKIRKSSLATQDYGWVRYTYRE